MITEILSPEPQRPHKRALANTDLDGLPASKRACAESPEDLDLRNNSPKKRRRLQSPRFEPTDDQQPPVTRPGSAPPWPAHVPGSKHPRPHLATDSPIDAWILTVFSTNSRPISPPARRSSTCPATVDICKDKYTPSSFAMISQMAQQQPKYIYKESEGSGSGTSSSGRPGTSHPLYRGTLYNNHIIMDYSGRRMPAELTAFASTKILKRRESPQLADEAVSKVIDIVEELADSTEGPTAKLLRTDMFPLERPGVAEGGNSAWTTSALPNNPAYQYDVSAPKPDSYFGYPTNQRSGWSYAQSNVVTHPMARPYSQPARGNTFPFLMVEMKSEAAGGTIYVAENQAAGSGSHSVNALLWLLREAGTYDSSSLTDTIAFSITMSHREAVFYLHWYSEADRRFYMSFLKAYSSMSAEDIRACNNTVKNIIDHGIGARKTAIGKALEALFPFPQHWKQARPPSTIPSTPATSLAEEVGANKRRKGPSPKSRNGSEF
ncbi:hypothetical protein LTR92_009676 [Exophiala xenobiotica]|nr:hypothetical protein LTR92_009676 [Exophiala xenobiotica]KAK5322555.1 hypothetical protein LTR93_005758 [Exophiala xenobiotica]